MKKISIVVPCYNEEEVLEKFYIRLKNVLNKLNKYSYEIFFIDDGSLDNTYNIMDNMRKKDRNTKIIKFSRNFGKEGAILAGLENTTGDLVVVMDADLQHPPEMILDMVMGIEEGFDVVTTVRKDRLGESKIRSFFSNIFYKIINKFDGISLHQGSQDFRIMTREVLNSVLQLKEYNRFSKGIFSWVGYSVKYIEIDNIVRKDGKSKWSFKKLFDYAIDGLISFTITPLKLSIIMGIVISILSVIYAAIIVFKTLIYGIKVQGYATIVTLILFVGGVQLLSIGILSEYVSKMYLEIKNRPKYIIKEKKE